MHKEELKYDTYYVVRFKVKDPITEIGLWNRGDYFLLAGTDWEFQYEEFDIIDELNLSKYDKRRISTNSIRTLSKHR